MAAAVDYIPLQTASYHSIGRGILSPEDLVARAAKLGLSALALTDRNGLKGIVPFVKAARSAGIRPIIGTDLVHGGQRLTVLARNRAGYAACCELVTALHLKADFNLMREVQARLDHLVVLCSDPELLPQAFGLFDGQVFAALARVPGHAPERLRRVAEALDAPQLAVGDVTWGGASDGTFARVLEAIRKNSVIDRMVPEDSPSLNPLQLPVLLSASDMAQRHRGEEALLRATLDVAEQCDCHLDLGKPRLPSFRVPEGKDAASWLRELAEAGAQERYGTPLPTKVRRRLQRELEVIEALDFPGYFLVVREIVEFAKSRNIPFVGRGSAADSLVVYALGFTRVDPVAHELVFERFLSRSRKSLPDIDLDFCWRRRDEVIRHVYERHGRDHVATISTHVAFRLRSAFREAAKAMGLSPDLVDQGAKSLPYGFDGSLSQAIETFPECQRMERVPRLKMVLQIAERLRGMPRHLGMHPGGIVISDRPLTWYTPLVRSAKGPLITQPEMRGIEALGLVKIDLLGQRSLSTIGDTLELIRSTGETPPDLGKLTEEDPKVLELLNAGRTIGCFQIESPGMRKLVVEMCARTRRDIIDAVALIRPGASGSGMKEHYVLCAQGKQPITYLHPDLEPVLRRSLGVMFYQEDVLRVCEALAGWPLEKGDLLRAALSKKHRDPSLIQQLHKDYFTSTAKRGVLRADAQAVWDLIGNFASFAYCKAHAATYGYLAWEELYLKAYHLPAFFCAILNNDRGYYEDRIYLEEALRSGVGFLHPSVNRSQPGFTLEGGHEHRLRIGLSRIRSLRSETVTRLLSSRETHGPYFSLPDFMERVAPDSQEARNLILAGAFDTFDRTRPELLWRLELFLRQRERATIKPTGESLLFELPTLPEETLLPRIPDYSDQKKAQLEYAVLGLTPGGGATVFGRADESWGTVAAQDIPRHVGSIISCFGWCSATRRARVNNGDYMRFITLEDPTGTVEGIFFPEAYRRLGHRVQGEGPYLLKGHVEMEHGSPCVHIVDFQAVVQSEQPSHSTNRSQRSLSDDQPIANNHSI